MGYVRYGYSHEYILHGTPDSLGQFLVYLTLSDDEAFTYYALEFHVVNFKPEIVSIEDIPDDQGGEVYLRFNRSFLDNGVETISYMVFIGGIILKAKMGGY